MALFFLYLGVIIFYADKYGGSCLPGFSPSIDIVNKRNLDDDQRFPHNGMTGNIFTKPATQ